MIEHKEGTAEAETRPEPVVGGGASELPVPGLTILWHPDLQRVGERALLTGLACGRDEAVSRNAPAFSPPEPPPQGGSAPRPLADPFLSRHPIWLMPGGDSGGVRLVCDGGGTSLAAGGAPVHGALDLDAEALERGTVLLLGSRVALLLSQIDPAPPPRGLPQGGMLGHSAAMSELRRELCRLAPLDVPVLLRGESGTGKELAARALHDQSPRARAPFIAVNLAAVPPALAAAELFGAARGAFTGADRARAGYFQLAAGGTLFLDEIGEASTELQALLLRALDSREIQEVGGGAPHRVDVRVVAATDANLEAAVAAGRFRAPLLHRLTACEIRLPALRQRRDDIGRLLLEFLRQELGALGGAAAARLPPHQARAGANGRDGGGLGAGPGGGPRGQTTEPPWLPATVVARLAAHDWPGNVRQLRNIARHLAVTGHAAATVTWDRKLEQLLGGATAANPARAATAANPANSANAENPANRANTAATPATPAAGAAARPPAQRKRYRHAGEVGDQELLATLRAHRFKLQPAAASLGISRTALYDLIERTPSLRKAADLSAEQIAAALADHAGNSGAAAAALEVSPRGLLRRIRGLGLGPSPQPSPSPRG